jgi:hypothetical protein
MCRVWGLLKYYHPNITAGNLDWDKILLDRLDNISSSSTPEAVNVELKKMLEAAGKYEYEREDNRYDSLKMNVSLCWLNNSFLDDTLQNELKKIASLLVKHPSYYGINFNEDMSLSPQHEKMNNVDVSISYKYRLLSLFRYWNVIYYFFPHKYLMDKSWDKTLSEFVFPFINADNRQSCQIALLKLSAYLNDGHGFISVAGYCPNECQDVIETIEGKTVLKIDAGKLQKGDIINGIGKRDIKYIRDSLSVLIPASTRGNKEYRINSYIAEMIFFHETNVFVSRNDGEFNVRVLPVIFETKQSSPFKWIDDDIGYVDLSILTDENIDLMFLMFSDAKGIIFDVRKPGLYKYNAYRLNCHLSDKKNIRMFATVFPDWEHPGAFFYFKDTGTVIPDSLKCPLFKGKTIFLINASTQSHLETKAWIARTSFHATLIGRQTSGALGQVVRVTLPECAAFFSGTGLFSLDGTELQRKGIVPDIEVYPDMQSVLDGKDEILERAIYYIKEL